MIFEPCGRSLGRRTRRTLGSGSRRRLKRRGVPGDESDRSHTMEGYTTGGAINRGRSADPCLLRQDPSGMSHWNALSPHHLRSDDTVITITT